MKRVVGCFLSASFLLVMTLSARQVAPADLHQFLRHQLSFTTSELTALETDQIIVRLPKTPEAREVAAFAIMRVNVPSEFFIEKVHDIVTFKKNDNVLQIGKFSDPPRIEDLANLTMDRSEIESIRRCRVHNCDFKLPAAMIERFRKEMDWSSPNYQERVTEIMRQVVLDIVRAYLNGGHPALGEYADKPYKLNLAAEFRSLLQPSTYMYGYGPEFQKYLLDFPHSPSVHVENFVYWSKEKLGLKPVISATHIAVHRSSRDPNSDVLIASNGIYANHYLEASLGLTAFFHRNTSHGPRTYLIYVNRSKADALRGMFAGFKRSLISGSLRDGAKKNMKMIKERLESDYSKP